MSIVKPSFLIIVDLTDKTEVVPSEDSHQSEYIAPCDARRGPV